MKILTKEEEAAHYNATLKGGISGMAVGLALGGAAVYGASRRFHTIRSLTLPMKAFLVSSSSTFAAIIAADRASRGFEWARDPQRQYKDATQTQLAELEQNKTNLEKLKDWGRQNRYPIVTASWVASMGIALGLVGRNPYLSRAQKLVQARVYAQGLTLAVLIATAAFEVGDANKGRGRWETIKVIDPNDPEHRHLIEKRIHHEAYEGEDLWRDMVETEERKMNARKNAIKKEDSSDSHKPHDPPPKYPKGKEAKDKIVHESKGAGPVNPAQADAKEKKGIAVQDAKESDVHKMAVTAEPQVVQTGHGG